MKNWACAEEMFSELNHQFVYLVLRNYEKFYASILLDRHADIDVLCKKSDKKKIVCFLEAEPRLDKDDGIHYRILIDSEYVPLDMRCVGDGYYDKEWEVDMLAHRQLDSRGFYHMSMDDYFWSLLYHALYHKGKISEEYYLRLQGIKPSLFPATQGELEVALSSFMEKKGYYYIIARDRYLWYHFTDHCKGKIRAYPFYKVDIFLLKCKEYLARKLQKGN